MYPSVPHFMSEAAEIYTEEGFTEDCERKEQ